MGQLKCKLVSSHVMYNGLLCPWSTSIIFARLKRGSTSLIIFGADLCCCDHYSHYLLMTFNLEKKNYTLVFLCTEYSSYECKLQISISLRKKKGEPIAQLLLMFCSAQLDSSLKRTRSQPTNMSTLVCWVDGIVFHKGRDNSLLNCWPWRAS